MFKRKSAYLFVSAMSTSAPPSPGVSSTGCPERRLHKD